MAGRSGHADPELTHARDGHQLLVAGADQQWAGVGAWLCRGLARDETVVYAGDAQARTVGELERALARHGVDVARAAADGRLAVSAPERYYSPQGHRELVEESLDAGRGIRTCNRADPRARSSPADRAGFERMLDELWRTRSVSTLCLHGPATATDADRLGDAVRGHGTGWADLHLHAHTPGPGRLVLVGEVDTANAGMLTAVVDGAARRTSGELVVDCGALTHMSVGAWRTLHAATAGLRDRGAPVRLVRVRPVAARVLRITGFDEGFRVETGP